MHNLSTTPKHTKERIENMSNIKYYTNCSHCGVNVPLAQAKVIGSAIICTKCSTELIPF